MSDPRTFVIVGASLAGAKAAEALRNAGFEGHVVLIGEETHRPYERLPLSKGYLLDPRVRDTIYVHSADWYVKHNVELRLGISVTAIHRDSHEVELADGSRQHYDKLLLATGAVVRRLENTDQEGVFYLRRIEDFDRLGEVLARRGRVVSIGGGWLGLEATAVTRQRGCEVTMIEPGPRPLSRRFGPQIGDVFVDLHRAHGVDVRLGVGLAEVRPGPVVVTTTGDEIAADAVIIGVGIIPATELAEAAGLEVANGIRVTAELQTTRDPDIYAAGACMNADNPLYGRPLRNEYWANALNGGATAARSMLGQGEPYDRVPYFYSEQYDLRVEFSGWFEPGRAEMVHRGDLAAREFIAFWLDGEGRVLAGMNANVGDVTDPIQKMIRSRRPIDRARLADPTVPLEDLIPDRD
jgi:3-phenylpropionate/trans-cinnamate dioxygenase ferredoxin reductase component